MLHLLNTLFYIEICTESISNLDGLTYYLKMVNLYTTSILINDVFLEVTIACKFVIQEGI